MKPWHSVGVLLLVAAGTGFGYTLLQNGKVEVCYNVQLDEAGRTGIYWDQGTGFDEQRRVDTVIDGGSRREVCFHRRDIPASGLLRVDPAERPGRFLLDDLVVSPLAPVLPWMLRQSIDMQNPVHVNDVHGGDGRYRATSNDPYIIWRYDVRVPTALIYAFNIAVVMLITAAGAVAYRRFGIAEAGSRVGLPMSACAFGFFAAYVLLAWLASSFTDMLYHARWALWWSLILLFTTLVGGACGVLRQTAAPYAAVLSVVIMVIGFDGAYRTGLADRQLFVNVSHDAYHWRLNRSPDDNFTNSSLRYYDDFDQIKDLIVPGAFFIADKATSYYVAAAFNLFPRITQPHHSRVGRKPDPGFLAALCEPDNDDEIKAKLKDVFEETGRERPLYVFIVQDEKNVNIRHQCTSRRHDTVERNIEPISGLIYSGEYVSVYRLTG